MSVQHSPEIEKRVIGALFALGEHNNMQVQQAMMNLTEECFYLPYSRKIFLIVKKLYQEKMPFDAISMLDLIRHYPEDVTDFFNSIVSNYFTTSMLFIDTNKLLLLMQNRFRMQILHSTLANANRSYMAEDTDNIINQGIKAACDLKLNIDNPGYNSEMLISSILEQMDKTSIRTPTGIKEFDDPLLGGFDNNSMHIIAGASGMGKTFLAIYLQYLLGRHTPNKQMLFFSLEMSPQSIMERRLGIIGGKPWVNMNNALKGSTAAFALNDDFTIFDEKRRDIEFIETKARLAAIEKPISVIVIDYLGLVEIGGKFERHDIKVTAVANRLTALAAELKCIILVTCQINRKVSDRAKDDRCPYPADAADSSGAERSCHTWMGIDRPERHMPEHVYKNQFIVKVRKSRTSGYPELILPFNEGTFTLNSYEVLKIVEIDKRRFATQQITQAFP